MKQGYFGDSALYVLSMRTFDSIKSPAFFEMHRQGLNEAIAKKSAHFDFVFHTSLLTRYETFREKEKYVAFSNSLIEHYKQQGDIDEVRMGQVPRLQGTTLLHRKTGRAMPYFRSLHSRLCGIFNLITKTRRASAPSVL